MFDRVTKFGSVVLASLVMVAVADGVTTSVRAEERPGPQVVASIKPLHSLVSAVMGSRGEAHLLLKGATSPHHVSLKPSDVAKLEAADLVVWIGPSLEGFLTKRLQGEAFDTRSLSVIETPGIALLQQREGALWDHDHDHGHEDHDEEAHQEHDHDEHAHEEDGHEEHDHDEHEEHDHDEHAHEEDSHEEHDHDEHAGGVDPHLWLDPRNAIAMVAVIKERLTALDAEGAENYHANAEGLVQKLEALDKRMVDRLAPLSDLPFVVYHDAYHYLEARTGLSALGAVALDLERKPGARHLIELGEVMGDRTKVCLFTEPQFDAKMAKSLAEESGAYLTRVDPLGAEIEPGPNAYEALMDQVIGSFEGCLRNLS